MIALALRYWWAVVIAVLLVALGAQTMRINAAHTEMAEHMADDAIAQARAQKAARDEETRRQAVTDEEAARARTEKTERERAIADLADTADGLRRDVEQYRQRLARASAGAAVGGAGKPSAGPADLLSDLYLGSVATNRELAAYADRLRGAGTACERIADAP